MPNITNRVLTTPGQQVSERQKKNARRNINAMEKTPLPAGEDKMFALCGIDGEDKWVELGLVDDPIDP